MARTLLLLPGDGIGPEVMGAVGLVIDALALDGLRVATGLFGGAAIDAEGVPLPPSTLAAARRADAVLMGAVGGPKWAREPYGNRPEAGLLALRSGMGVFANLRPAKLLAPLSDASPLKPELSAGLDMMFVRELVGGVYFGEPRGIERLASGERVGVNTQRYSESEIIRVARVAFGIARGRAGHVTSVDKANVMESGLLWRETVTAIGAREFADVPLSHMYADTCAMQLVKAPRQFDVVLTDNLFGDLLSDLAAMLTGSLGLLPSAALGAPGAPGLYEPIHGSAPDIAGRGIANPCAAILSLAMALRHSLGQADAGLQVEQAVERALAGGARTADIGGALSTMAMAGAVVDALEDVAA